jgi:sarcosine oxidase
VVGAGVIGLGAARALADDGFAVTVYEQDRVGSKLGSSPGRSRIFRRAYDDPAYVRLAVLANAEWRKLDPSLLCTSGLLLHGAEVSRWADAMAAAGQPGRWLEPAEAEALMPEARFTGPVLLDADAGAVMADDALQALARGVEVREATRIDDPRELEADVVAVCAGPWLGRLFDLPLWSRIEQVSYFRGAPDDRPAVVQTGGDGHNHHYALVAPGVGYKVAEGEIRGKWDPDRPDRPVEPEVTARLVAYVRAAFPGLDPEPVHSEACLYTHSPDSDFILDTIDGVVVCGGDSGHAFKFGPLLGRLVADLAQGRPLPPEAERFRCDRLAV